jgi:hypothetical protein
MCNKDGKIARIAEEKRDSLLLSLSEETNGKGLSTTASFTTMLMTAQFLVPAQNPEEYELTVMNLSDATKRLFKDYSAPLNETDRSQLLDLTDYSHRKHYPFVGST